MYWLLVSFLSLAIVVLLFEVWRFREMYLATNRELEAAVAKEAPSFERMANVAQAERLAARADAVAFLRAQVARGGWNSSHLPQVVLSTMADLFERGVHEGFLEQEGRCGKPR